MIVEGNRASRRRTRIGVSTGTRSYNRPVPGMFPKIGPAILYQPDQRRSPARCPEAFLAASPCPCADRRRAWDRPGRAGGSQERMRFISGTIAADPGSGRHEQAVEGALWWVRRNVVFQGPRLTRLMVMWRPPCRGDKMVTPRRRGCGARRLIDQDDHGRCAFRRPKRGRRPASSGAAG